MRRDFSPLKFTLLFHSSVCGRLSRSVPGGGRKPRLIEGCKLLCLVNVDTLSPNPGSFFTYDTWLRRQRGNKEFGVVKLPSEEVRPLSVSSCS